MTSFVFVVDHSQFKKPTLKLGRQTLIPHPEGVFLATLEANKGKLIGGAYTYTTAQAQNLCNKDLSALGEGEGVCLKGYTYVYRLTAAEEQELHDVEILKKDLAAVNASIEALVPASLRDQKKDLEDKLSHLAKRLKV